MRVASCDPAGSCNEESMPESMTFKSDSGWFSSNTHSVVMQYTIIAPGDTEVRDVIVHALDPRHVRVTYVVGTTDSEGLEHLVNEREDILSVDPSAVEDTERFTETVNGSSLVTEEKRADLRKCSQEFLAAEQKYIEQHNMVEKADVSGQVPSK